MARLAFPRRRGRGRSLDDGAGAVSGGPIGDRLPASGDARFGLCRAPFGSMYFDQFGRVRMCCQNTVSLMGDIATQSIREIWDSGVAQGLRDDLAGGVYPPGCEICVWMDTTDVPEMVFARTFDELEPVGPPYRWPAQMEFSISNACNLQCVMCSGEFSSAIRAHRERLPALAMPYGEAFFEELVEFLAHLDTVKVLGGEPFLSVESMRVMELAIEHSSAPVTVTTNATQWNDRVARLVDSGRLEMVVSLDGVSAEVYESIRVGASFDKVLANVDRMQAAAARHGRSFWLAHCLMTHNWFEFPTSCASRRTVTSVCP
ncbi:MAG: radical SAM protein [Microthrixaceae bacterium]